MSRRVQLGIQRGMIFLLMSLLTAMLTLMAGSTLRLATLKGRSSDGFRNHVQALHAAEIALAHCEEIVGERIKGASRNLPATPSSSESEGMGAGLTPLDEVVASATWRDSNRWKKYSEDLIEVPLSSALSLQPGQCVIDELRAPHRFVTTARGFSPNYSRADHDFAGAEVWVQSVSVPAASPDSTHTSRASNRVPLHSWRQLTSPPH